MPLDRCKRLDPRDPLSSVVFGHREQENDPKIVLLALALQMNLRESSHVVDSGQPILPLENIDWIICESKKVRNMRLDGFNAMENT